MTQLKSKTLTVQCNNEYDTLNHVIVVSPDYMEITTVINETQMHYTDDNIDVEKAKRQHEYFVEVLRDNGVSVTFLDAQPELNEQVFTRDIGFTVEDKFFLTNMGQEIRKPENDLLKTYLEDNHIEFIPFLDATVEGGDVIIDNSHVWVGRSARTESEAADFLKTHLPHHEVTEIKLREDILHLDCVFNILEDNLALIFADGMDEASVDILRKEYEILEVTEEEQFQMGPNVLSIGSKKVLSLPENSRINKKLQEMGYEVFEIPFSEIIKSGGAYRCCSLPVNRG